MNLRVGDEVYGVPRASVPVAPLPEYNKLTLSLVLVPHCDTRPLQWPQKDPHVPRHIAGGPHHETTKILPQRHCALNNPPSPSK